VKKIIKPKKSISRPTTNIKTQFTKTKKLSQKMASANYMNGVMNLMNDMKRDFLIEVLKNLENKELLTDEIKEIVEKMTAEIKNNKKLPKGMKKEKKPRFSGYTLYLKEQRVVVKAENPDVRTTDDHFLMEIAVHDNEESLAALLKETGAVEINIVDKEEDAH
jgi:uncharacterized protein YacL (UPF0231 family)